MVVRVVQAQAIQPAQFTYCNGSSITAAGLDRYRTLVLTHNVMILLRIKVFYRAGQNYFLKLVLTGSVENWLLIAKPTHRQHS